ncbi:PEPxxWA-CTERM sorting domain-containing protein [Sphingomonas sp.]|uniref:PEPxxWA-CTERM sorting domain-containing protein n=1 Tax=Sphingomonas sp. TaxID=28214 RepID=UPI0038A2B2B3
MTACAVAALGIPLAWSIAADPATDMVAAAVSQAQDLAELLSQRSPGARTASELTKTKHARTAARLRTQPKVTATPRHAAPPAESAPIELAALLKSPVAPVGLMEPGGSSPITPPPSLGSILGSAPGTGDFTPPGGGGGTATFPTEQPRELVPVATAVPEPGTWAMMLMGFGLIGWRLRRRRRTAPMLQA